MPINENSDVFKRATQLSLQLAQLSREAPSDEGKLAAGLLREDADQILTALEAAASEETVHQTIRCFRKSLVGTLRLKREVAASSYLGLLEQNTFQALELEINQILSGLSRQLQHARFLRDCLNPEIAYCRTLMQW